MGTLAEAVEESLALARHKLTVADFQRMAEANIIDEDAPVELIEGEIFDVAPIGSPHAAIVDLLVERFILASKGCVLVRGQGPLQMPPYNELLPDVLLLKPQANRYRDALPQARDVLLVIEVAHASVGRDRDVKIPIYGREGIPEAWLVEVQRQLPSRDFAHCPPRRRKGSYAQTTSAFSLVFSRRRSGGLPGPRLDAGRSVHR